MIGHATPRFLAKLRVQRIRGQYQGAKTGIASVDYIAGSEDRHCVGRLHRSRGKVWLGGAKTGIASVDYIAVAARFGSKLAGLTLGE
jgi:hypothetical protein